MSMERIKIEIKMGGGCESKTNNQLYLSSLRMEAETFRGNWSTCHVISANIFFSK